jgi:hypothetical protein
MIWSITGRANQADYLNLPVQFHPPLSCTILYREACAPYRGA